MLVANTKRLKAHVDIMIEELKAICTQYHWLCEVSSYILTLEGEAPTKILSSAQDFEVCACVNAHLCMYGVSFT